MLRANISLITSEAFEAAKSGDRNWTRCEDQSFDLDADWHAINFLLTGDGSSVFLQSGVQIGQVSEHCEVHSPQDVAALHTRLSNTSASELMSAFDSTKFDQIKIYPGGWAIPTDVSEPYTFKAAEESDKYQKDHLEKVLVRLIAFVQDAAEKGLGFFVTIL